MPIVIRYTACQILPAQICISVPGRAERERDREVRERSFHFTALLFSLSYFHARFVSGRGKKSQSASHISAAVALKINSPKDRALDTQYSQSVYKCVRASCHFPGLIISLKVAERTRAPPALANSSISIIRCSVGNLQLRLKGFSLSL